jgi:formate hydrogenlyase subunit 6/NADH:ubiquinone oxidoreductase subunit I
MNKMNPRKIRTLLAVICVTLITLLFLDFTGTVHRWFGWLAKIQFVPALLALNAGVVILLVALTLLAGRVYCSVICPLGVFQDVISRMAGRRTKNRFSYSPAVGWSRYSALVVFVIALVAGIGAMFALLEPYGVYGRVVSGLFAPLYQLGNNALGYLSERAGSYAFYPVEVWVKGGVTVAVAAGFFVLLAVLAWRGGRTYCNTVCPVGTALGLIARFSLFKPVIDTGKCTGCGACARDCKASCINHETRAIDYSRCVACMNCVDKCRKKAIAYTSPAIHFRARREAGTGADDHLSRRRFLLSVTAMFAFHGALKADGGLAVIEGKKIPARATPILPAGARGSRNMSRHCTACQLCVSLCPNKVLRPSTRLATLMQPEMSYEKGYCRPECVRCSEVCPTGAIQRITREEKTGVQIGHAVWIRANCVVIRDGVTCTNCARHCPAGAIQLVPLEVGGGGSPMVPAIDAERCIGCGACEHLCPARPFSAIYVEGHERHGSI